MIPKENSKLNSRMVFFSSVLILSIYVIIRNKIKKIVHPEKIVITFLFPF